MLCCWYGGGGGAGGWPAPSRSLYTHTVPLCPGPLRPGPALARLGSGGVLTTPHSGGEGLCAVLVDCARVSRADGVVDERHVCAPKSRLTPRVRPLTTSLCAAASAQAFPALVTVASRRRRCAVALTTGGGKERKKQNNV